MSEAGALLRIDETAAAKAVAHYLFDLCAQLSKGGVLIGLSGGIDSAVLAALAVQGLGCERVRAAYLYDRDSGHRLASNARRVAASLGLKLNEQDIGPEMARRGIYSPLSVRLLRISGVVNRVVFAVYRLVLGEVPFVTYLRAGANDVGVERERRLTHKPLTQFADLCFNARHIYRREVLEAEAADLGWLVIGAANRSEWQVGWFVKDGVDDLPHQPLIGLYKTQVRQMAGFLGLPDGVLTQPPSPDMMRGITDEFGLGVTYSKIDLALDHLEGGISKEDLQAAGVAPKELRHVREINRLSAWKRRPLTLPLAADGGPQGGLRR